MPFASLSLTVLQMGTQAPRGSIPGTELKRGVGSPAPAPTPALPWTTPGTCLRREHQGASLSRSAHLSVLLASAPTTTREGGRGGPPPTKGRDGFMKCHVLVPGKWRQAQPQLLPGDTHHSSGRVTKSSPGPRAAAQVSDCGFVGRSPPACSRSHSGQCSAGLRTDSPLQGGEEKGRSLGDSHHCGWGGNVGGLRELGRREVGDGGDLSSQNVEAPSFVRIKATCRFGGYFVILPQIFSKPLMVANFKAWEDCCLSSKRNSTGNESEGIGYCPFENLGPCSRFEMQMQTLCFLSVFLRLGI